MIVCLLGKFISVAIITIFAVILNRELIRQMVKHVFECNEVFNGSPSEKLGFQ